MTLDIIIPLYNENVLITQVLDELLSVHLPDFIHERKIIVVDDASKDSSYSVVEQYSKGKDITLIRHEKNKGKGAAVKTGFKNSSGDLILIRDADLELSAADIPRMLEAMRELNVPFINGSRYMPGIIRTQSAYKRYFFNKLFTVFTSLVTDVYLTDMACGYKLLTRELFEKLNLKENRFGFEAELIIKCARKRRNWIAEIPVRYFPRNEGEGKKLRNSDGWRILKTIIKYGLLKRN